jgi:glycerol-3-phosphate dehydrogenase
MKRDLTQLTNQRFDLLVIGGGITGANIAWDAALRGLRVALLEREDFGAATSANSLKTVHGGLRYLQDGNLPLVRKMVRERQALLRVAPHLIRPLPVIMPTYKGKLLRGKLVLGTAVKLNDLASFDRNFGMGPGQTLPNSRILSREETLRRLPGLETTAVSGSVLWHDAQIQNSERLLLSIIQAAVENGAQAANYVRVSGFLRANQQVVGVIAEDALSRQTLQIRAAQVVNAAGPWIDELLADLGLAAPRPRFPLSTAMNLVTRQLVPDVAMGITGHYQQTLPDGSSERRSRVLFVAPWRDYSLVGTLHAPYNGRPDDRWLTEQAIQEFLDEVNAAYPGAKLRRDEVYQVHRGFLPMLPNAADPTQVKLIREGQVVDHEAEDGVAGLITAVGVKYTTARHLAEKVVDLAFQKLERPLPPCQTDRRPVYGGHIPEFDRFLNTALASWPVEMPPAQIERLLRNYGSAHRQLFPYLMQESAWREPLGEETAVTPAELRHAIHQEMAERLSDLILRRTELGSAGPPALATLEKAANLMTEEKGWDHTRRQQEIENVLAAFHSISQSK